MTILKSYLIKSKINLLLIIVLLVIFNLGLFLYNVHQELFFYLNLLSIVTICIFLLIDYLRYKKHYLEVKNYLDNVLYSNNLIQSDEILENRYLEVILELKNQIKKLNNESITKYNDLLDYYTLWIHQIKTPIAAMHLILDENKDLKLNMELLRIEEYVQMVLSYLKIIEKDNDYVFKEISLDAVINETIKNYASIFILKKIKLSYKETNYHFISDEKWLSFVIGQIISNSLKYTKNEGEIKIYLIEDTLYIEDNGIGIKKEDLPRIFDKGYSGFVGREYKKASGIGLYLAKKICDNLHIQIKIDSILNKKTVVSLKFNKDVHIYE